jgi:hypothetical protein
LTVTLLADDPLDAVGPAAGRVGPIPVLAPAPAPAALTCEAGLLDGWLAAPFVG